MNNVHRPRGGLQEADAPEEAVATEEAVRSRFSDLAGRFANWMTGADRLPEDGDTGPSEKPASSAGGTEPPAAAASGEGGDPARFALAPFGYNRAAVDEHLAGLERELEALRAQQAPMASITDELERIGEQTASILVVAHDQAHETTRLAEAQAERCVADAAANAVQITAEAKERLRELDAETDAVWRERERLLEDVRVVSAALANLANQASERFPAAEPSHLTGSFPAVPAPAYGIWEEAELLQEESPAAEPQATQPFPAVQGEAVQESAEAEPVDTGSWLIGLEPPDLRSGR
jgi:cell division septum initiation protein DivIVA